MLELKHIPVGFKAYGTHCGIKKNGALDLSLLLSTSSCVAAGVFTTNYVKAASVLLSQSLLERNSEAIYGVLVSSGNANAATGMTGLEVAKSAVKSVEGHFNLPKESVLIAQTGLIGVKLNPDIIPKGVSELSVNKDSSLSTDFILAAKAMMTTDTVPKGFSSAVPLSSGVGNILALGKGVAMLRPNMATMLVTVLTDIKITQSLLQQALLSGVSATFHQLSIDGCQSTNDTVFILSNWQAGNHLISDVLSEDFRLFTATLQDILRSLSISMASDAEGGTKFIHCEVSEASSKNMAESIALQVVNSTLVKCAIAGECPYWGRVLAEVGAARVPINPDLVDISFGEYLLCKNGEPVPEVPSGVYDYLKGKRINIKISLKCGSERGEAFGSDLTPEYVRINMDKS
jgi:glutamate N-acetyltransferase/amino-acid N-acetyltransferase